MKTVAEKERREQGGNNFFLQQGVILEMTAYSRENEEVDDADEGTDMGELNKGNKSSSRQLIWRRTVCWPRSLTVMRLMQQDEDLKSIESCHSRISGHYYFEMNECTSERKEAKRTPKLQGNRLGRAEARRRRK